MFKIIRKIYNHNRTYKKSKEFDTFEEAYEYADKYTRVTFSIYKIETEIFEDSVLVYYLNTDGEEYDMRNKKENKKEYTVYRGSRKLFTTESFKKAKNYAQYWAEKDRLLYIVRCGEDEEHIYEPPEKILGWYVWELGERFKTIEEAEKHIASIGNHKEFNIYKVVEGDLLNDKYIKYKTVQAL